MKELVESVFSVMGRRGNRREGMHTDISLELRI